jgi:hypothetical protein
MGLIKIIKKVSSGNYENYYVGTDIKSIVGTTSGTADNTQVSTIVLKTISGVTATIILTPGVQAADLQTITQGYFWDRAVLADSQGSDFAGLVEGAQIGATGTTGIAGGAVVGSFFLLLADGSPATVKTDVTIDSVTIS